MMRDTRNSRQRRSQEDERLSEASEAERPWGHGLPDDGDAVPCDECEKMLDIKGVRGTFYARCSCCINSQLLKARFC